MASAPLLPSTDPRTNQNFEPPFEWVRRDDRDTLLLDVSGFKKEQLKIQVNSHGNLKVSGERFIYGNQRIRFTKDFQVPNYCDTNDIRAKFQNGLLYVIMPKSKEFQPPSTTATVAATAVAANAGHDQSRKSQWTDDSPPKEDEPEKVERRPDRPMSDHRDDNQESSEDGLMIDEEDAWGGSGIQARNQLIRNTLMVILVALGPWIYFNYGFGSLLVGKRNGEHMY